MDIAEKQQAVRDADLDGWLLYDFRGGNPLARSVLGLKEKPSGSRRWFYFIPGSGEATKIVHAIEADALDSLPGKKIIYRGWRELHESLASLLADSQTIAMEYSPNANNPYVSRVDGGTIDLVRNQRVEIVSSGNLIQYFETRLTEEQWETHLRADHVTQDSCKLAWEFIEEQVSSRGEVSEQAVCDRITDYFESQEMMTYSPPIVARAPNNRLPHYETGTAKDTAIRAGDLVMIDQWCKMKTPGAIYSDVTRMAYLGESIPEEYEKVFAVVVQARDAGINLVKERFSKNIPLHGWEVDRVVRDVIESAGYGDAFLHRTGHSLGEEVHGNGAHLDDLEMHEDRLILPCTLFTIEPGIYLQDFGVRSEVDLFIDAANEVHVTGGILQREILKLSVS